MPFGPDASRARVRLLVWWMLWLSMFLSLGLLYFFLGRGFAPLKDVSPEKLLTSLAGLVPLFLSIIIRWLVLPRFNDLRQAFPLFLAGLALAETCGVLGLLRGGPYREDLFLLGLLGIAQFVPFFARKYLEPKPVGFVPNN